MSRRLIVVCGPPCSGKSSLARELSARTGAIHLELDELLVRLRPESKHSQEDRDLAYRAMHTIAEFLLRSVDQVILDATYARENPRKGLEQVSQRAAASVLWVQCRISPETARTRFLSRRTEHFASDLNEERVFRLAQEYPYTEEGLVIDATASIEGSLEIIESYPS